MIGLAVTLIKLNKAIINRLNPSKYQSGIYISDIEAYVRHY